MNLMFKIPKYCSLLFAVFNFFLLLHSPLFSHFFQLLLTSHLPSLLRELF